MYVHCALVHCEVGVGWGQGHGTLTERRLPFFAVVGIREAITERIPHLFAVVGIREAIKERRPSFFAAVRIREAITHIYIFTYPMTCNYYKN